MKSSLKSFLLLFQIFLFSLLSLKITASPRIQAEALIQWKNSLSFSPPSLNSWSINNIRNLCNWTSITCNSSTGMVSEINLSNTNITGSLAQFNFTPFSTLTRFDLHNNILAGLIPPTIGSLSKLTHLDLSNNNLVDIVPVEIGQLIELQYLNLFNNSLNGSIPYQVSHLQKVWYLDLGWNYLTNPDWSKFLDMPLLVHLGFSNDALTSVFPPFIINCRNLTFLDLSINNLTGPIPESVFTNLVKLKAFNLSHNSFQGPLSSNISKLSNLVALELGANQFSGPITEYLKGLTSLENLNVSHNHFFGRIPSSLSNMSSLHTFDFSYNELTGPIPTSGQFQNNSSEAFVGNLGLCGENVDGLNPCSFNNIKSSKINTRILITVLVSVCVLLVLISIVAMILMCLGYNKLHDEEVKSSKSFESFETIIWGRERIVTYGEIVRATEDFHDKYRIGKAGFKSVYKALLSQGQVVAVKKLTIPNPSDILATDRQSIENEIRVLTNIRHQNIIKLHGSYSTKGCMYLVYDYVERGSLRNLLYGFKGVDLGWVERVRIVQGLAHALAYLHHDCSPPIVHGHISLKNILLDLELKARLFFDTLRLLDPNFSNQTTVSRSYDYTQAPELALAMGMTDKCDIYSFGMVVLEVMMGRHPGELLDSLSSTTFSLENKEVLLQVVRDPRLPSPTGQIVEDVVFVVKKGLACTRSLPESRPIMHSVAQELSIRTQAYLAEPLEQAYWALDIE